MRIKPKKSLGQNFLIDKNIQKKIITSCGLQQDDTVLEIGAGRGEITTLLSGRVDKVYALEVDPQLCRLLGEVLKGCANVKIINRDILKFDFAAIAAGGGDRIKVIGNIPYYISSPIITRLIELRRMISVAFLTLQKELATRIKAGPGSKDYGAFSCFVQYYARPQILFSVKKNSFAPAPKVDSAFLRLEMLEKPQVSVDDEELFFKIIRASFNQRRKTLRNSLQGIVQAEKLKLFFQKYGVDRNVRPERLSLEDFAQLANL